MPKPRVSKSLPWSTRARWTADDARAALAALERSKKSVGHFAATAGVDPQRFYAWRRRFAGEAAPSSFVEVVTAVREPLVGDRGFEVVLRTGHVVRVPQGFDVEALKQLVAALEGGASC